MPYKVLTDTGRTVEVDTGGGSMYVESGDLYFEDGSQLLDAIFAAGSWQSVTWHAEDGD